jgi:rhodanese-related sulfurtransferase
MNLGGRFMMLCGTACALAALTAAVHPRPPRFGIVHHSVSIAAIPSDVLWIDARPEAAFAKGCIPGAINVSEDAWIDGLERLVTAGFEHRSLVVYCESSSCPAAAEVAERLERELGIDGIRVLEGGWQTWSKP